MKKSRVKNSLEKMDSPIGEKLVHALNRVSVAIRAEDWESAGELGINPSQKQVLMLLHQRVTSLRLSEIATELVVSAATVSDSVSSLEQKGLVRKEKAVDDGRAVAIGLTAKGKKAVQKLTASDQWIYEILDGLPPAEKKGFYKTLLKIIRELQVEERIPVARMCITCRYFRPNAHSSKSRPHHCDLVNLSFGDQSLRLHCPDHETADGL